MTNVLLCPVVTFEKVLRYCPSLLQPLILSFPVGYFAPVETTIFREILQGRCSELNEKGLPPLVVDVGANIGFVHICAFCCDFLPFLALKYLCFRYFTAYAAAFGCRVMAFEPIPKILRYLNLTILLNGFIDRVEVPLHPCFSSFIFYIRDEYLTCSRCEM
jgi:hypothetical protein